MKITTSMTENQPHNPFVSSMSSFDKDQGDNIKADIELRPCGAYRFFPAFVCAELFRIRPVWPQKPGSKKRYQDEQSPADDVQQYLAEC
jgi:hypothetical protein